ncbi:MAG: single-stranded-DNA-specific exonuclease RecJ [Patescibacteria group bacterium]
MQLLFNRQLKDREEIERFLSGELKEDRTLVIGDNEQDRFYDPFLFKDMEASVQLIIDQIKAGAPVLIYGDYDADGVTSSAVLLEVLQILQAQVEVYLPDRVSEGYGLNKAALDLIAKQGFKLIITVDTGIRNQAEVAYAKSLGLEIIITDHHLLPETAEDLPDCLIINPADKRNNYPGPTLAGVGVAFKLASALIHKAKLPLRQKQLILEKILDLVAVGTIADLVSLLGENRLLVKRGLEIINRQRRLGLRELIKVAKISEKKAIEAWQVGWQLGPRLNAASRLSHANTAFSLLITTNQEEASSLANELNQKNLSRQKITEEIRVAVEQQLAKTAIPKIIISVAPKDQVWNEGVIGLVAGKITEKYYRPSLIIIRVVEKFEFDSQQKKLVPKKFSFKGSGRSIPGFNLVKALESCAAYLDKYGGHPLACGFTISSEENLEKFKKQLREIANQEIVGNILIPKLSLEMELKFAQIDLGLVEEINRLAPFGQDNQPPKFASYQLKIEEINLLGLDKQHIKIRFSQLGDQTSSSFWGLAFGEAERYQDLVVGEQVALSYYLEINEFNNKREVQLKIIDLKLCQK